MADWVKRDPLELVAQVDLFITGMNTPTGLAASNLIAAQFTALDAERDTVDNLRIARDNAKGILDAAQDALDDGVDGLRGSFRGMGNQARHATGMTDPLLSLAGLPVDDTTPSPAPLVVLNDVVVLPRPSGSNLVDWTGPTGGGLLYLIFSRKETEAEWTLIGSVTRTEFLHVAAGVGVRRHYRVVSQRGDRTSEPSNVATAYA